MDKQELKSVIQTLSEGDQITVTFPTGLPADAGQLTSWSGLSEQYTVTGTKRGRGKGGSQLMSLKTDSGDTVTVGTPHSDYVLNVVTPDGELHGYQHERQIPKVYEKDASMASHLKEKLSPYVAGTPVSRPEDAPTVAIEATVPEYDGKWCLMNVERMRGRYGQLAVTLSRGGEAPVTLRTYRHSGVIRSFTIDS